MGETVAWADRIYIQPADGFLLRGGEENSRRHSRKTVFCVHPPPPHPFHTWDDVGLYSKHLASRFALFFYLIPLASMHFCAQKTTTVHAPAVFFFCLLSCMRRMAAIFRNILGCVRAIKFPSFPPSRLRSLKLRHRNGEGGFSSQRPTIVLLE